MSEWTSNEQKVNRALHLKAREENYTGIIAVHHNVESGEIEGALFVKSREEVRQWEQEIAAGMIKEELARSGNPVMAAASVRIHISYKWFINGNPLDRALQPYFAIAYNGVGALLN